MKQIDYASCPVCGFNHVLFSANRVKKGKPASLKWADFDIATMEFIQTREGGGDKSGFHKIGSLTLQDAISNGAYLSVAKDIGAQIEKAYKEFKKLGLI